ncbi:MAG: Mth938-like domain-containing protein [Acidiferrobacterales bacterium]
MSIQLLDTSDAPNLIRSHTDNSVTIGETIYTASLIISPGSLDDTWGPESAESLSATHVHALLRFEPELVLIGTGLRQAFPALEVLKPMVENQIGYEIMNTAAACRTYNILVAEGRAVVAGLIVS